MSANPSIELFRTAMSLFSQGGRPWTFPILPHSQNQLVAEPVEDLLVHHDTIRGVDDHFTDLKGQLKQCFIHIFMLGKHFSASTIWIVP
jgi:hypothetical protein